MRQPAASRLASVQIIGSEAGVSIRGGRVPRRIGLSIRFVVAEENGENQRSVG
jgi:hypothetical protein